VFTQISSARPGLLSVLDYSRADLWGLGALAYEIFGADNPFYTGRQGRLDSRSYQEQDLPPLPDNVPHMVKDLVAAILNRQPAQVCRNLTNIYCTIHPGLSFY